MEAPEMNLHLQYAAQGYYVHYGLCRKKAQLRQIKERFAWQKRASFGYLQNDKVWLV